MKSFSLFFESASSSLLKDKILGSQFLKDIRYLGGRLHFVGGSVRDFHLNLDSKDIDVIVSNLPSERLFDVLKKHGKVDEVGESFGVLKFIPNEFKVDEPIDIALPRTERPMNQEEKEEYRKKYGRHPSDYQAFKIDADHELGVEDDLGRRDFTINAIAQDHLGNYVDPHEGMEDIKKKLIRMVSPKNFSEDPLRMLRGVQFASRFGFKIEPKTFEAIRKNSSMIKGIPGERILLEIDKIVKKGDQLIGAKLLCETNLWQEISNLPCKDHDESAGLFQISNRSKNVSEFLYLMSSNVASLAEMMAVVKKLKCDLVTEKQVGGLHYAWNSSDNPHWKVFNLNRIHPTCIRLMVFPKSVRDSISSDMPKSFKELEVNGNDLMSLGYKGEAISEVFKSILDQIFNGSLRNSKQEILGYLSRE